MSTKKQTTANLIPDTSQENKLQIFQNEEFGNIRAIVIDDEPWFVGKDVAVALGYSNTKKALIDHVDAEDKMGSRNVTPSVIDSIGREQHPTWINESGLYGLILGSKLPTAKKFKRWITSEVIPSIRKHGAYMTPETIEKILYNPDFIMNLAGNLKAEQEKNKELTATNEQLTQENSNLKLTNSALASEIMNWDYKPLITKLIRRYAHKMFNGCFAVGYVMYYDELLYKYGINLKTRKTKSGKSNSCLDFIRPNEIDAAVNSAIAMCENSGIDVSDLIAAHI